jgi:hypothetical protein
MATPSFRSAAVKEAVVGSFARRDAAPGGNPERVIDIDDIRRRYPRAKGFLDERSRRLFAANEAMAQGYGGVTATAAATGLARSTITQ